MPKRVGRAIYVHRSALSDLDARSRLAVIVARTKLPAGYAWSVVKVAPGAVTFGRTTDWNVDPHPALLESVRVGQDGSVRRRREGRNPPIYHRKETMVSADHPMCDVFAALSASEQRVGLLGCRDIGRRDQWQAVLERGGWAIVGHQLVQRGGSRNVSLDNLIARAKTKMAQPRDPLEEFAPLWRRLVARYGPRGDKWPTEARQQLDAFEPDLRWYDLIVINTSGGKDSMVAMLKVLRLARKQGVVDRLWVIHCELGEAEHPGTRQLAQGHAKALGLPISITRHPSKTMLQRFEERLASGRGRGWPDHIARYCTSEFKTGRVNVAVNAWISERFGAGNLIKKMGRRARILNVLGLRADESAKRGRKPPYKVKRETKTRSIVHEWLPVQSWRVQEVWQQIERSGLEVHPWYAQHGGERLSCRFCPLAGMEDLALAGRVYPEEAARYIALEKRYSKPIKKGHWLIDIIAEGSTNQLPLVFIPRSAPTGAG